MTRRADTEGKDPLLVAALVRGLSQADAAAAAGVSVATVTRRMKTAVFRGKLSAARAEIVSEVVSGIVSIGSDAVATVREIMHDPAVSAATRLRAALGIIEMSVRLPRGADDLSEAAANAERSGHQVDGIDILLSSVYPY